MLKCQDLIKFQFWGGGGFWGKERGDGGRRGGMGGYSWQVTTEKSSSAKICLNFNLGGGVVSTSQN